MRFPGKMVWVAVALAVSPLWWYYYLDDAPWGVFERGRRDVLVIVWFALVPLALLVGAARPAMRPPGAAKCGEMNSFGFLMCLLNLSIFAAFWMLILLAPQVES